jgi:hypothetical protein
LCAFDLIEFDEDYRRTPIEERKRRLARVLRKPRIGIVLNEHYVSDGAIVFQNACRLGGDGIVSKRLGSLYHSGRSPHWTKVRNPPKAPAVHRRQNKIGNGSADLAATINLLLGAGLGGSLLSRLSLFMLTLLVLFADGAAAGASVRAGPAH